MGSNRPDTITDRHHLTAFAFRALEDALAQAEYGTVSRTWGHRLALAWLARAGIAEGWQCREFWQAMGNPYESQMASHRKYLRVTMLTAYLRGWYRTLGQPEPDILQRSRWARAYALPIDESVEADQPFGMCNLYRMTKGTAEVARLFRVDADPGANFGAEVYPGYPGLVIAAGEIRVMAWGFPLVLRGKSGQPLKPKPVNNAREDKLTTAFWRDSFAKRRCLIPVSAWAEAEGAKGHMTRTWYSLPDQDVFAVAGLWRPTDEWGDAYSMVMVDGCPQMADVHDRMPTILHEGDWDQWQHGTPAEAFALCQVWTGDLVVDRTAQSWRASGERVQSVKG